jgi:hypothetical protein
MPTQEERLTIKAHGEMAIEMVMVKGLVEDAVKRLASLRTQVEAMDAHFERMDTRLDRVNTRLDRVESLLAQILERLPEKP